MSFVPASPAAPRLRFRRAAKPNFNDFSGPPDGDYVRYVAGLMDWAQEEQERLRLQALVAPAQTPGSEWGREPSRSADRSATALRSANAPRATAAGQVARSPDKLEKWKRRAQEQAARVQREAAAPAASTPRPAAKGPGLLLLALMIGMFLVLANWLPAGLPVLLLAWLVWNIWRSRRSGG